MEQSLASVMRNINDTLRLDDNSHNKEAYVKYLDCIFCITCNLQQAVRDEGGDVVITRHVTQQVKLAQQCIERVAALVDNIGVTQKMIMVPKSPLEESRVASKSKPFAAVPPLPFEPTVNSFNQKKRTTPLQMAYKQNQQLMSAYRARMARMNKGDPGAYNLSLTLQRKIAENLAIAKKTEMALSKKMQERQERLEEQASKRFAAPIGMSKEEQEQRQIYKKILEYEHDAKWLQNWRVKLSTNPQEPELICQLIQEILRCQDHPLTVLLKQYQFKIYEKIYPLVHSKKQRLEAVTVPLAQALWPAELCGDRNEEQCLSSPACEELCGDRSEEQCLSSPACEEGTTEEGGGVSEMDQEFRSISLSSEMKELKGEFHENSSMADLEVGEAILEERTTDEGGGVGEVDQELQSSSLSSEVKELKEHLHENSSMADSEVVEDIPGNVYGEIERMKNSDSEIPQENVFEQESSDSPIPSTADCVSFAENTKEELFTAMKMTKNRQERLKIEQSKSARVLQQVTQDYERYNAENMDDLFDEEAYQTEDAENCLQNSLQPSHLIVTSPLDTDSSLHDFPSMPPAREKEAEVARMSKEAYHRHVKNISSDVHFFLEKLLIAFTIAYEELDSPLGRDQCYASLEECLFKPLWKYLLMLFRLANYKEEINVAYKMTQYADISPSKLGVRQKLCLLSSPQADRLMVGSTCQPYEQAIKQLMCIKDHYTMLSKLECIVKVVHQVCDSVRDFYISQGCSPADVPSVGADDLVPVISYVVLQSRLPQLVSECQAMSEFIHEGYIMGQEGYCLTTLETAVSYIAASDLNTPCSPT